MAKRPTQDSLSMALFGQSEPDDGQPGLGPAQQSASDGSRTMVLHQPMRSVALTPTRGSITRAMLLMWLKIIQEIQHQPEAQTYEIPMKLLVEFMGDAKNYDRLKENLKALASVQVEWNNKTDDEEQWVVSALVSQAKVTRAKGTGTTVHVSLPPDINVGVRNLKQFSALNLMIARELKNPAALNLYRIAVAYETNPSRLTSRASPEEWEPVLRGTPRPEHSEFVYKYFKRDTLLPALAEVNRLTNLTLELIEHREGRSVKELQFRVNNKGTIDIDGALHESSGADVEALEGLIELGVRRTDARQMLSAYGADRIRRNVEYVNEKKAQPGSKIKSLPAYVKAAVQNDYADAQVIEGEVTLVTPAKTTLKDRAAEREIAMERFKAHRRAEASELFLEMTRRDSDAMWDTYMARLKEEKNRTLLGAATSKGLKAKIVQVDFYDWVADKLLGEITEASFMDFLLSQTSQAAPRRKSEKK